MSQKIEAHELTLVSPENEKACTEIDNKPEPDDQEFETTQR
jgi:hypothetical protein